MVSFQHDDNLDPAIKAHIQSLYEAADHQDQLDAWAAHFADDVVVKKSPNEYHGKAAVIKVHDESWAQVKQRTHIVYQVFSLGKEAVMFHGRSNNTYKNGETKTFTWAARQEYTRMDDGRVLIQDYTIIVDPTPKIGESITF